MNTDELILNLAAHPRPAPPVAGGVLTSFSFALAAALVLLVLGWGLRADFGASLADPLTAMKPLLPGLIAVVAIVGALRLARPDGYAKGTTVLLLVLGGAALGLAAWALAQTPPAAWGAAVRGRTLVTCLLSIPALALLPTLALLSALRRGASLTPTWSGALAGLGGGAAAAAVYALHCDEDAPLFFVTWYGTAILMMGAVGALMGRRMLRW